MNTQNKIKSRTMLKKEISRLRRRGKTIVFTNGCFDILHLGHVRYLETAKKENRVLIVGLNGDLSIRKIKGNKRPIVSQKQRAGILAALACVDYVTIFNEETPLKLIEYCNPDILIKGADWKGKKVSGEDVVKSRGGKVEFVKFLPGFSTTRIIKTITRQCVH